MATSANKQSRTSAKTKTPPEPESVDDDVAPPPKKKGSLLKILLLATLLLAVAGGGAWYFVRGQEPAAPHKAGAAKTAKNKAVSDKPPAFVALEPFTVNLQHDDASAQYLQVGLSLKLTDDTLAEAIKLHMPEIRNRVLLLLSSKKASEISTLEGKKALSAELMHEIAQPLTGGATAPGLDSVLFTSFVIQ